MKEVDLEKLFETAGGKVLDLEEELYRFAKLLHQNFELRLFFENPAFSKENKLKLLREVQPKAAQLFQDLISLLLTEGLEKQIIKLSERFTKLASKRMEINFVEVTAAHPLSEEELKRVERFIGGKVKLRVEVDPALIGGVKVLTSDGRFFDATLQGGLEQLKENLVYA